MPQATLKGTLDGAGQEQPLVARLAGSSCRTFSSFLPNGSLRRGFGTTPLPLQKQIVDARDTAREGAAAWRRGGRAGRLHTAQPLRRLLPVASAASTGPQGAPSHPSPGVSQSVQCPTLCDPMDCSTPGFPEHHQLLELTQTHVHRVGDAIQPSHPLLSPSPTTFNLSQHQGLFQ